MKWFPAFFEGEDEKRVLDFTGGMSPLSLSIHLMRGFGEEGVLIWTAGNAFLGGYVAGLSKCNGDAYEGKFTVQMCSDRKTATTSEDTELMRNSGVVRNGLCKFRGRAIRFAVFDFYGQWGVLEW